MMNLKVFILDFDGVILESEGIKDQAFRALFEKFPDHLEDIMAYHKSNNAIVRFDKFRHITEHILRRQYTPELEQQMGRTFSRIVFQEVMTCPFVEGAKEFLEKHSGEIPMYMASVNPREDLLKIMDARDVLRYFKEIYASPWLKKDAIADILAKERCAKEETVFIGDSYEDYEAAVAAEVPFIGRDSGKSFRGAPIPVYKNFFQIEQAIR